MNSKAYKPYGPKMKESLSYPIVVSSLFCVSVIIISSIVIANMKPSMVHNKIITNQFILCNISLLKALYMIYIEHNY